MVSGNVKDQDGGRLPGVSIRVKEDTKAGTVTNTDGSFNIKVLPQYKTLVFSSIGYTTIEVAIAGKRPF